MSICFYRNPDKASLGRTEHRWDGNIKKTSDSEYDPVMCYSQHDNPQLGFVRRGSLSASN